MSGREINRSCLGVYCFPLKKMTLNAVMLLSFQTLLCLFQASYEPAVSPVRSPVRIPSPDTVTPPLSASDVERNIKDAVSTLLVV